MISHILTKCNRKSSFSLARWLLIRNDKRWSFLVSWFTFFVIGFRRNDVGNLSINVKLLEVLRGQGSQGFRSLWTSVLLKLLSSWRGLLPRFRSKWKSALFFVFKDFLSILNWTAYLGAKWTCLFRAQRPLFLKLRAFVDNTFSYHFVFCNIWLIKNILESSS